MLNSLREGAKSWVAKVLFFLLVLSFGVWGVTGSMFAPGGDAVITAGDTEVSTNEFRLAYDRQMALVSQQIGQRITREQARAFGLENQVYAQLLSGALLDEQSRDMGLGLSEDRLAALIAEDPAFRGIDGRFSRENFAIVLQNAGMTQDDYINSREQLAVRTQVIEALSDGFVAPQTLIAAVERHAGETRTVDYVVVDQSVLEPVAEPTDAELTAYFAENREAYAAPEYRRIAYLELTAETLADPAFITDEAVDADLEASRARSSSQERRTIDQLLFPDREAAAAAVEALNSGTSFEDIAAEQGRSAQDIRLGTFTRAEMASPAVADAAFAVEDEGGTSEIVDGPFGPVILRVAAIEGEGDGAGDEAAERERVRQELALAEAAQRVFETYDRIEDARAGGAPLEETAEAEGLEAVVIDAIDRTGRRPDGEIVADIPASTEVIAQTFEAAEGEEIAPIAIGSDGYVWAEVLGIEPARERELEEVRERVVADWKAEQTAAALMTRVEDLRQRLAGGEPLSAIAAELNLQVETRYGLQRGSEDPVFGAQALAAAFDGPRGTIGLAEAANGSGQVLMQVSEIVGSGQQMIGDAEREQIASSAANDLLDQVISRLQTEYPVSINQTAGERALSF
jgi:peptidyl-prolyl cis-trans isomerase D